MDVYLPGPVTNRFGSFPAGTNTGLSEAAASALVLYGGGQVVGAGVDIGLLKASEAVAVKGLVSGDRISVAGQSSSIIVRV